MTTAQAKRLARKAGIPFAFDGGHWTLDPRMYEQDTLLPFFFTASSLLTITPVMFLRYIKLIQQEQKNTP